jgi:hypothetical protein
LLRDVVPTDRGNRHYSFYSNRLFKVINSVSNFQIGEIWRLESILNVESILNDYVCLFSKNGHIKALSKVDCEYAMIELSKEEYIIKDIIE